MNLKRYRTLIVLGAAQSFGQTAAPILVLLGGIVGAKIAHHDSVAGLGLSAGFERFGAIEDDDGEDGIYAAYVGATLGNTDRHVSVNLGRMGAFGGGSDFNARMINVSANLRVSRGISLMTENWLHSHDSPRNYHAFGMRLLGDAFAADFAFILAEGASFPIPWLDITWNWE